MPPKPKFTREEIVATALNLVSEKGVDALTAKELGIALGSSARPIFTVFKNMKEVQDEVRVAAMQRFESYSEKIFPDMPLFKQVGMRMVLFSLQEPKLYQLLFMQESKNDTATFDDMFGVLGATAGICIEMIQKEYELDLDDAKTLFQNVWIYTFGIGVLCATGVCRFSEHELGYMLTTEFQAMIMLVKSGKIKTLKY